MINDNNIDQCKYLYNMASLSEYNRYKTAKFHDLLSAGKTKKKPIELARFTINVDQKIFDEMIKKMESQGTWNDFYPASNFNHYEILANKI